MNDAGMSSPDLRFDFVSPSKDSDKMKLSFLQKTTNTCPVLHGKIFLKSLKLAGA